MSKPYSAYRTLSLLPRPQPQAYPTELVGYGLSISVLLTSCIVLILLRGAHALLRGV